LLQRSGIAPIVHRQSLHDVVHRVVEPLVLDRPGSEWLARLRVGEPFDIDGEPDRPQAIARTMIAAPNASASV